MPPALYVSRTLCKYYQNGLGGVHGTSLSVPFSNVAVLDKSLPLLLQILTELPVRASGGLGSDSNNANNKELRMNSKGLLTGAKSKGARMSKLARVHGCLRWHRFRIPQEEDKRVEEGDWKVW